MVAVSLLLAVTIIWAMGPNIAITHAAFATIGTIKVGLSPDGVGVDPSRNLIYVANSGDNTVSVISGLTNTVTKTVSVGDGPSAVAVNPSTGLVYVPNIFDNNVSVINESTERVVKNVSVGNSPDAAAVDLVTDSIYIANQNDGTLSVINGSTNVVMKNVTVGDGPDAIAVNPTTDMIYVANSYDDTVSVINGTRNEVVATVPVGDDPTGVAVNPATGIVYVTNFDDWTVSVINGSDYSPLVTVNTVGQGPDAIAIDSVTNAVYVGNNYQNSLSILDGASNAVLANVTVGAPTAVAVNPSTNLVYTTSGLSNSVLVVHGLKRVSQTYVVCSALVTLGESAACTALIIGASPSGQVTWDSTGAGSFLPANATCTISSSGCAVSWQPSPPVLSSKVEITATFSGNANDKGSSGDFQLALNKATSATSVVCTPQTVTAGSSITCRASVAGYSPTGEVAWSSNGTVSFSDPTCTLSAKTCSVSLALSTAGSYRLAISAIYLGDSSNSGSSGVGLIRISPASPILLVEVGVTALVVVVGIVLYLIRKRGPLHRPNST